MSFPVSPTHHRHGGIRKRPTSSSHGRVRWIHEHPEEETIAARDECASRGTTLSPSASTGVSKVYRITSSGEKYLRAPLLNTHLLADAPLRLSIGSANDPFSNFPAPWKPPYGIVTSYFRYVVAPVIVEESFEPIDNQSRQQALDDIEWPMALSVQANDAALFFASLAMSTTHLPDTHELSPKKNKFFFRWISSKCVEHLNRSLSDPVRACSDASVAAVAFISFCESMAGSHRISATVHQPGLRQMVKNRGGLPAIAASSSAGKRVAQAISSFDLVVAQKFGGAPIFADSYILALEEVELNDILPRIKQKAQKAIDSGSPVTKTVALPQRSRSHREFSANSTVYPYDPLSDVEPVYEGTRL